jgi:hypothetical protein
MTIEEFKLLKPGDLIKCIYNECSMLKLDKIYTLKKIDSTKELLYVTEDTHEALSHRRFEVIKSDNYEIF